MASSAPWSGKKVRLLLSGGDRDADNDDDKDAPSAVGLVPLDLLGEAGALRPFPDGEDIGEASESACDDAPPCAGAWACAWAAVGRAASLRTFWLVM